MINALGDFVPAGRKNPAAEYGRVRGGGGGSGKGGEEDKSKMEKQPPRFINEAPRFQRLQLEKNREERRLTKAKKARQAELPAISPGRAAKKQPVKAAKSTSMHFNWGPEDAPQIPNSQLPFAKTNFKSPKEVHLRISKVNHLLNTQGASMLLPYSSAASPVTAVEVGTKEDLEGNLGRKHTKRAAKHVGGPAAAAAAAVVEAARMTEGRIESKKGGKGRGLEPPPPKRLGFALGSKRQGHVRGGNERRQQQQQLAFWRRRPPAASAFGGVGRGIGISSALASKASPSQSSPFAAVRPLQSIGGDGGEAAGEVEDEEKGRDHADDAADAVDDAHDGERDRGHRAAVVPPRLVPASKATASSSASLFTQLIASATRGGGAGE